LTVSTNGLSARQTSEPHFGEIGIAASLPNGAGSSATVRSFRRLRKGECAAPESFNYWLSDT